MPYIHEESIFPAIMKVIGNFSSDKERRKAEKNKGYKDYGSLQRSSIMRASKDLVMSFPVLCSNTINPTTASMINKAIERNMVTTLQLLFSSAYLKGYSGQEVIKKWHNNMDDDMSMDEYLDVIDSFSASLDNSFREATKYSDDMIRECTENLHRFPESSFSENSINTFAVTENYNGINVRQVITEANDTEIFNPANRFYTTTKAQFDADMEYEKLYQRNREFDAQQQNNINRSMIDKERNRLNAEYNDKRLDLDNRRFGLDQERNNLDRDKFDYQRGLDDRKYNLDLERNRRSALADEHQFFQRQLLDSDVKKCNELVPSMMIVRFNAIDPENPINTAVEQQFIAGVKARLIPCDSFEIINRIRSIEKNKVNLVNLIRATTKEISFAKDFVAGIEQAKIDAKQNSKLSRTSPIWRSLQNRATKSGLNRLNKKVKANDAGAITTLVITQEEVNFLKKEYNIDLNIPAKAKTLMEAYNLIGLVIVDENVEVARFLFDGEKYFQDYSFGTLERETGDGSYKKVINLISKINRG